MGKMLLLGFEPDIIERKVCHNECTHCHYCVSAYIVQDRVPAFSGKKARELIAEELGAPVDVLFKEFEDQPIAAASLGQVYSLIFTLFFYDVLANK